MPNNFNVIDDYKSWALEDIRSEVLRTSFPYAVMMQHIQGDYNISTLVRNANAFGARKVFYYGKRKWDRRGSVGTHHYTDLEFISDIDTIVKLKRDYHIVGVENNVKGCKPIDEFQAAPNTLFIFGEEGAGIQQEVIDLCDELIYIPQFGSVRSLNVGTCSGIVMNDYIAKITQNGLGRS